MRKQDSEGQTKYTRDKREEQTPCQELWRLHQNLGKCLLSEKWVVLPAGDIWQCLGIYLAVTTGVGRMLQAPSRWRPGVLHRTGQPPTTKS